MYNYRKKNQVQLIYFDETKKRVDPGPPFSLRPDHGRAINYTLILCLKIGIRTVVLYPCVIMLFFYVGLSF